MKSEEQKQKEIEQAFLKGESTHTAKDGTIMTKYVFQKRLKGHSSFVTHIDWSMDGRFLQSNCASYEHLYWNCETGEQVKNTAHFDCDWDDWTCVLGFPVMGIWPDDADGSDVNAVHMTRDETFVVTADDYGKVRNPDAPRPLARHSAVSAFLHFGSGGDGRMVFMRVCA